eukprot:TRINITY_DN48057_c0_g1_i1.p1 TRINITY_DN48057_c0_g1~~TRINITY_DN48057_c0_g1_i1.p1  ORF type:complete len:312 (+),score=63.45 TRINITY_DN48057_c0_g1_i1:71-937(+)
MAPLQRRHRSALGLALCGTLVALHPTWRSESAPSTVFVSGGRSGPLSGRRGVAMMAGGDSPRAAHIAVVDVDVKAGDEDKFLQASLDNARASTREETNQRFDVLQSVTEPNRFALVEIYRSAKGPTDHKATDHYNTWRERVSDMMASPRSATQWDTRFPSVASGFMPGALILERPLPEYYDVTHVYVDVVPGKEQEFLAASLENAQNSIKEIGNLRFDILQSVEDSTKFMLIEVYKTAQDAAAHKQTEHYLNWRETVADMMNSPRVGKKYKNHFPNLAAGWQTTQIVK